MLPLTYFYGHEFIFFSNIQFTTIDDQSIMKITNVAQTRFSLFFYSTFSSFFDILHHVTLCVYSILNDYWQMTTSNSLRPISNHCKCYFKSILTRTLIYIACTKVYIIAVNVNQQLTFIFTLYSFKIILRVH